MENVGGNTNREKSEENPERMRNERTTVSKMKLGFPKLCKKQTSSSFSLHNIVLKLILFLKKPLYYKVLQWFIHGSPIHLQFGGLPYC